MIGLLRGIVWDIDGSKVVLDLNGVGFNLFVPEKYLDKIVKGQDKVFYTHLVVKEDSLSLFGFLSKEEKALFISLLSVSGVGPKSALALLSMYSTLQIKTAIAGNNLAILTKVAGVGNKTAQRLVLELKEKYKNFTVEGINEEKAVDMTVSSEAMDALQALGFSVSEAQEALSKVISAKGDLTSEELIKEALKLFASR